MQTRNKQVDVAIVGAGSAGLSARRAAKAAGARVAMIDPGPFGTTCARVGCMPSKLLIAASDAAHHAASAELFGVRIEGLRVDGRAVLDRVRAERDRFVGFVLDTVEEAREQDELLEGHARTVGPGRLVVEGREGPTEVSFGSLVVATGSAPFVPPPFRGLGECLLTTDGVFELDDLPESLLVVGIGVIGLELGQAMARLGVRTTLIGIGGFVGPLTDPEVLQEARGRLGEELDLHPEYALHQVETRAGGVRIRFTDSQGRDRDETFERAFVAAGRTPNLEGLELSSLGAEADARGRLAVDPQTLQVGELPLFVAGDANGLHPVLHEAADDGKIAGENAARFPDVRAARRRAPLTVVFSDPQIAVIGCSYDDLGDCHAVAGEVSYANQGRARVQGVNRGKVRIYAERESSRLLGAELFGPAVEHLAHLLAWAVQARMSVEDALAMPFYHPVVEEGVRTALRDLQANLRRGERIKCRVSELGVGS